MASIRVFAACFVGLVLAFEPPPAFSCSVPPTLTLSQEGNSADLIVFGTLSNAKPDPMESFKGTTDLTIETVAKGGEFLKGKKVITLPRLVKIDPETPTTYMVFGYVTDGRIDDFHGETFKPGSKIVDYLKGALAFKSKDAASRLQYFFNYLDSTEDAIAADAHREIENADYKEIRTVCGKLPAEKMTTWLKDPKTPVSRLGLYGLFLGHCGNAKEHAPLLLELARNPATQSMSGFDRILEGYVMLAPKAGWKLVRSLLADEKRDFLVRYSALRAVRFFWDYRRDIIPANEVMQAMTIALNQGDMADLPIEDLRRWGRWELTEKIISLYGLKSHDAPIIRRSIIRFALCAPADNKAAAEFIKARRAENPERVEDIENLLVLASALGDAQPTSELNLWPVKPPGELLKVGPEKDLTKAEDELIAGRRIIKLGNVTKPQIHVFLAPKEKRNGTAVVICPGGGFHILAWDLEGTEVAEWLNSLGVSAIVLKYRVPSRQKDVDWLSAVQDAQRAMSITRSKAKDWGINPDRIGILGFSAGGFTASHVTTQTKRLYEGADDVDKVSFRPDFAIAIYPGGMIDDKTRELKKDFAVTKETPPMFFAHAFDDPVSCESSVQLFLALKKAGVASELHVYDAGGHGYGMRAQADFPVTTWPKRCEEWLGRRGWLKQPK
jgi:acetyl esterase/lipase